jgi:predicted PurR-regulated permease PerM
MEFFIPSIILFLFAIIISFVIIPRFTPLITGILAILMLFFGVYHHYKMFASEYRLSTWQSSLKIYAPAIMIAGIILFIIYSIISFFSKGSVPIPIVPTIETPDVSDVTNTIANTANNLGKKINTLGNTLSNTVNNIKNTIGDTIGNTEKDTNRNKNRRGNGNENNITNSLLEVL